MIFTASLRQLSFLCILLSDERVIYQRDNGMWRLGRTTIKEQYQLMQLTCAFKTIIFLAPLIAGKTVSAELPIILAEESSWLLHTQIFYARFQLRHTMASRRMRENKKKKSNLNLSSLSNSNDLATNWNNLPLDFKRTFVLLH